MSPQNRTVLVLYHAPPGREFNRTFLSLINLFDGDKSFTVNKFNYATCNDESSVELDRLISQADCIFLHYSLLYQRVRPATLVFFKYLESLRKSSAFKMAMPQDEGNYSGILDDLLIYWGVNLLISVHYSEDGPIYPNARETLETVRVLPAFLEREWMMSPLPIKNLDDRQIALGYRGRAGLWRHGKANYFKSEFALKLSARFESLGWSTDVSLSSIDRLYGEEWQNFIQNSRLVYGAPGGYTAIDYYGELNSQVDIITKEFGPDSFDEFYQLMPSEWDNSDLLTLTARHFEAAYFGTPQILLESHYRGLLVPDKHYIPISKTFSNFDELVPSLTDYEYLLSTVEAFREDVFKEEFTYDSLKSCLKKLISTHSGTAVLAPDSICEQQKKVLKKHAEARLQILNYRSIGSSHLFFTSNRMLGTTKYIARRSLFMLRRIFFATRRQFRFVLFLVRRSLRSAYYYPKRVLIKTIKFLIGYDKRN